MLKKVAIRAMGKAIRNTLDKGNVNVIKCLDFSVLEKDTEKKEEAEYRYLTSTQRVRVN